MEKTIKENKKKKRPYTAVKVELQNRNGACAQTVRYPKAYLNAAADAAIGVLLGEIRSTLRNALCDAELSGVSVDKLPSVHIDPSMKGLVVTFYDNAKDVIEGRPTRAVGFGIESLEVVPDDIKEVFVQFGVAEHRLQTAFNIMMEFGKYPLDATGAASFLRMSIDTAIVISRDGTPVTDLGKYIIGTPGQCFTKMTCNSVTSLYNYLCAKNTL